MTKVISISDEAYEMLKNMKNNSSFSEVIINLSKEKNAKEIMDFAGVLDKKEGERLKKVIYNQRKIGSRRFK